MPREVGEVVGVDVSVRSKLEPLRGKLVRLVDRGWLRKQPDGRFTRGRAAKLAAETVSPWRQRRSHSSSHASVTSSRSTSSRSSGTRPTAP